MDSSKDVLDDDGHRDAKWCGKRQPQGVLHAVIDIEQGLIPQGDRAGEQEAEAHGCAVIGNDSNQIERDEQRKDDPQEVGETIVHQ